LAPVFKEFGGSPGKDGVPKGPIVIFDACYYSNWFKLLPANMRIREEPGLSKEGIINHGEMMVLLTTDLTKALDIIDKWRSENPQVAVTVRIMIGFSGSEAVGDQEQLTPDQQKMFSGDFMFNWIGKSP
jgi:hypothetical protein